jgi:hypothetical protein
MIYRDSKVTLDELKNTAYVVRPVELFESDLKSSADWNWLKQAGAAVDYGLRSGMLL